MKQHIKMTHEMWQLERVDNKRWKATYLKEHRDGYLTLTGSANTIELDVPFPFRLVRVELTFDDATSRDIDIYFIPRGHKSPYPPRVYHETGATFTDLVLQFAEGYEKESAVIRFTCTGTADKLMYPTVYVQEL